MPNTINTPIQQFHNPTNYFAPDGNLLNSLPRELHNVIHYAVKYLGVPEELAFASALGAISHAAQGLVDVSCGKQEIPIGLFIITIADSGEGKTSCDKLLLKELRNLEATLRGEGGGMTNKKENSRPWIVLHANTTLPGIVQSIAKGFHSAALMSSEGATILFPSSGGNDMFAFLNSAYSGEDYRLTRKTSGEVYLRGYRLTALIQSQPGIFKKFILKKGDLARSIGLLPRFMVFAPQSTCGFRYSSDQMPDDSLLTDFYSRISKLYKLQIDSDGNIPTRKVLALSESARQAYHDLFNQTQTNIRCDRRFFEHKDFAMRIAEQALRIAAVLHVFSYGPSGEISRKDFDIAARLAVQNFYNWMNVLNRIHLSTEEENAKILKDWLCQMHRQQINMGNTYNFYDISELQRYVPRPVRGRKIHDAIDTLVRWGGLTRVQHPVTGKQGIAILANLYQM